MIPRVSCTFSDFCSSTGVYSGSGASLDAGFSDLPLALTGSSSDESKKSSELKKFDATSEMDELLLEASKISDGDILLRLRLLFARKRGLHVLEVAFHHSADVNEHPPLLVHWEQTGIEGERAIVHERLPYNTEVVLDQFKRRLALIRRQPREVDVESACLNQSDALL
ncbi:outer membrane porin, putative [Babesia ovata]|uniref:Outer membrane porin, putative n=1 Tax=Babesia ovata TaxID=189622 RepID=A0A2H6K9M7_9APIC|nr:outer membrane porin, putative [Babesia ovata]GBE59693.1 outer membrane porin, putative [Babesia ovata]